jgi:hypothetical protein
MILDDVQKAVDAAHPDRPVAEREAFALGIRAAAGDVDARRRMAVDGGVITDGRGVRYYLDQKGFGELIGATANRLRLLRDQGRLIPHEVASYHAAADVDRLDDPEVEPAFRGWSMARGVMFGIEMGYLSPIDGTRLPGRAPRMRITLPPAHWRLPAPLVGYLTPGATADFLGITVTGVYQSRGRDRFPDEAVVIGVMPGWAAPGIRKYNERRSPYLRAKSQDPGGAAA